MATIINEGGALAEDGFSISQGVLLKYSGFADTVIVPEGVTSVSENAFSGAWSVFEIVFPEGLLSISDNALCGCANLTTVTLPDTLCKIGKGAFKDCTALKEITLPKSAGTIPEEAFFGCSELSKVTVLGSLSKIGKYAFRSCRSLTELSASCSRLSVGDGAFADCESLAVVSLSGDVSEIGGAAFARCKALSSFSIPETSPLSVVSPFAFALCESLRRITLPVGVADICTRAFDGCVSLSLITVSSESVAVASDAIPEDTLIFAPHIPLSAFSEGRINDAVMGFLLAVSEGAQMTESVRSENEEYIKKSYRDITSRLFRGKTASRKRLELMAEFSLENGLLTERDARSYLSSPHLSESHDLCERLSKYIEHLPKKEELQRIQAERSTRITSVFERYLGKEDFSDGTELAQSILKNADCTEKLRELISYSEEKGLLTRDAAELLMASERVRNDALAVSLLMSHLAGRADDLSLEL